MLCDKILTANNSYVGSHVKRVHGILLHDYVKKYYTDVTSDTHERSLCSCGEKLAEETFIVDHLNKTFEVNYSNGFICNTIECKNKATLKILNEPYNPKIYEHIGSRVEYLSYKYKISMEESVKLKGINYVTVKRKNKDLTEDQIISVLNKKIENRKNKPSKTNLNDYIARYGIEVGTAKYNERCEKISKAGTKNFYLQKYGEIEGENKWKEYIDKLKKRSLGTTKSKISDENVLNKLHELHLSVDSEFPVQIKINQKGKYVTKVTKLDYYLRDFNIAIEFYGDYWHANPKSFKDEFFIHKSIKKSVFEIWNKDKERINQILSVLNCSVLIIWESSSYNLTVDELNKHIEFLKKNKTTLII